MPLPGPKWQGIRLLILFMEAGFPILERAVQEWSAVGGGVRGEAINQKTWYLELDTNLETCFFQVP